MRTISNSTKSAAASDSIYNESSATLSISGLTGAEVAPLQISGDNVNFVNYYEGGSLVQLSVGAASKSLTYPGYYRVSVPNTSATASVSVVKPEWNNIVDTHGMWGPSKLGTNLLLWLDAKRADSVTQIESKVSQWSDRSGNSRHVTQTSAASRPAYSSSTYGACISYAAGNRLNIPAGAIAALSPETLVIAVLCNFGTSGVTNRYVYYNGLTSTTDATGNQIFGTNSDVAYMYNAYDSNSNNGAISAGTINANQDSIVSAYNNGSIWIGRQYGVQTGTKTPSGTYNQATAVINSIGYSSFDGKIYSIIVANYTSALDVQRLEGYICHRYGAQALLASDHPYRYVAP